MFFFLWVWEALLLFLLLRSNWKVNFSQASCLNFTSTHYNVNTFLLISSFFVFCFLWSPLKCLTVVLLSVGTPSFLRQFRYETLHNLLQSNVSPLQFLFLGGEPFPSVAEWRFWLPNQPTSLRIFNLYGITEVSVVGLLFWKIISTTLDVIW
jgi:hypothetical protein